MQKLSEKICNYPDCDSCTHKRKTCAKRTAIRKNEEYFRHFLYKKREMARRCYHDFKEFFEGDKPYIFSFGAEEGVDYFSARSVFDENFDYVAVEDRSLPILETNVAKNVVTMCPPKWDYKHAMLYLDKIKKDCVLCLFGSYGYYLDTFEGFWDFFDRLLNKESSYLMIIKKNVKEEFCLPFDKFYSKIIDEYTVKSKQILNGKGVMYKFIRKKQEETKN